MKTLVLVWSNGEKEERNVPDEFINNFDLETIFEDKALNMFKDGELIGSINLSYVRKIYIKTEISSDK